ncbi:MAG: nucleotidyltransferase domain-containing protein [Anaerolineales bacterium]|nr:nucleotidyltransferase domain-containing protein [Anaerolineales bacterium]MCX7756495.1 nucleotidyltransferase domain-containing protein [Anaerolineales bacterium]MDW8278636.1 nucleotidyltransferase domain-containing protein [Anaerolineales bacterium]
MTAPFESIQSALSKIEAEEKVKIFYACESGSRAWGFPSADSDYDVRFLYIHPVEWYLSVEEKRDVIERPLSPEGFDVSGWDLRKALRLFRKSNPPLLEWLGSPIIYRETTDIVSHMRQLAEKYYSPLGCIYHYLHMARGNYRDYLRGERVWTKKYFYVLRPLLAILWIERGYGVAPTAFSILLDRLVTDPALREAIDNLIEQKRQGNELSEGPRIPLISEFIESELARLETAVSAPANKPPMTEINNLFLHALHVAWQD